MWLEPDDRRTLMETRRRTGWTDVVVKPAISATASTKFRDATIANTVMLAYDEVRSRLSGIVICEVFIDKVYSWLLVTS